jgi:hypothetical protein
VTYTEGWPRKMIVDVDIGDGAFMTDKVKVVPLSDAERLREELETRRLLWGDAGPDVLKMKAEIKRLREALEGIRKVSRDCDWAGMEVIDSIARAALDEGEK